MSRRSTAIQPQRVALAWRVTGDRQFVDWVRSNPAFDSLHAMAKCLAYEMAAAGCVRASSGSELSERLATITKPYLGRFQQLVERFEVWSASTPDHVRGNVYGDGKVWFAFGALAEYLENLFVSERGAISREEIERIGLALVVGVHGANDSSAHASKGKSGRKPDFPPQRLEILRKEAFRLLDHHGGLNNNDPEFNSKEKLIEALQKFATTKPKQFPKEPGRTTLQPHVDEWIELWQRGRS
jgi:hypothetical protein